MLGSQILLQLELDGLREFLEHSWKATDPDSIADYDKIDEQDLEKLYFRQQVTARAVFHEINILIEQELYYAAHDARLESDWQGPKNLLEITDSTKLSSMKLVTDLPIGKAIELIEKNIV